MDALKGLKAKKSKTSEIWPPQDIRENTKARREWLAAKLAEVNAQKDTEGRIVESGSYQHISVYTTTYTEGRIRHQGVCQFCGRSQVTKEGVLVLHGYTRPGYGYVVGECPGQGLLALQIEETRTVQWRTEWVLIHARAVLALKRAEAKWAPFKDLYLGSRPTMPSEPRKNDWYTGQWEERLAKYNKAMEQWKVDLKAWNKANPDKAKAYVLRETYLEARNQEQGANHMKIHFTTLMKSGTHGQPLTEEVVA